MKTQAACISILIVCCLLASGCLGDRNDEGIPAADFGDLSGRRFAEGAQDVQDQPSVNESSFSTLPTRGTLPRRRLSTLPRRSTTLPSSGSTLPRRGSTLPRRRGTLPKRRTTLPARDRNPLPGTIPRGDPGHIDCLLPVGQWLLG